MKNDFLDNIIKEKLNQQEYEFTSADWDSFESKRGNSGGSDSNAKWFLGGAAAVAIIAVASYIWLPESTSNNTAEASQSSTQQNETPYSPSEKEVNTSKNREANDSENSDVATTVNSTNPTQIDNTEEDNTLEPHENSEETTSNEITFDNSIDQESDNTISPEDNNKNTTDPTTQKPVEITVPSAAIMVSTLEICPGESISLETIEQPNVTYAWNLGDDTYSNDRVVNHEYNTPGKYIISLIVTSSVDRSILSKSKEIVIEVLPAPNTDFEVDYLTDEIIPSVKMTSSEILPSYYWDFGDGTHSTESSPTKGYKKKGYYNITLSSETMDGCKSKTTHKVTIKEDYNLLAPNSFTPNGDGINDYFIPEALKLMDVEFTMSIFSKTEGLIFESKNINQQWDGRNQQNGQNCIEDTYIWVVSLTTKEGKSEQYKGAVLLLK